MTFMLGSRSLAELKGVHPDLIELAQATIAFSPVDFAVHDGLRTEAEQRAYVKSGVSQTMDSKHREQKDGLGHAMDLVPYINGKLRWEWDPIYEIAAALGRALIKINAEREITNKKPLKIRWGGCWRDISEITPAAASMEKAVSDYGAARRKAGKKAFTDGPHFEILE